MDDIGYEVPTIDGGGSYHTPNIDALAAKSIRFTQCYSCPLCSPSRVEMITGKYNFRNYETWGDLDPSNKTIGNLMKNAGYATGVFGKWQHGGGASSLTAFGFESYIIHDAFGASERGPRYKNPRLYTHGDYLPDNLIKNKFGDDIVRDSLFKFMEENVDANKPFFAYYPMILCHKPFQPTPDDAAFREWDPANSDQSFYPSMVKYMDKIAGQILKKVNHLNISDNTIIIFTSDNGTPHYFYSLFNGELIRGGKGKTNIYGTHVPLFVYWQGRTRRGIDSSLIDFSDFLPTLCDIADGSTKGFGELDGVSFYHNILGDLGKNREWSFCDFHPFPDDGDDEGDPDSIRYARWAQNTEYKKYDTVAHPAWKTKCMFKFAEFPTELPQGIIEKDAQTKYEKSLYNLFDSVFKIEVIP